jgi:pimeloyl-ACP methyl ester carboxylesterase
MNKALMLVIGFAAGIALPTFAATPIPPGKWSFVFTDPKGRADRPIRVYTYRPKACDTTCPIQIVLHGAKRNDRDHWTFLADRYKLLIVAPEFLANQWPKAAAYNLGDVATQADREKWAFAAIEHIFDEVRDGQTQYAIFGHGAGGQFVQRMAFFRPDNRASVMVAANPGWYTLPEWRKDKEKNLDPFPYSLVGAKVGDNELRQALPKRFLLLIGGKDEDPDEENLSAAAQVKKQGDSPVDRGENFFKAVTSAANDLGVKLGWELTEVPDVQQDGYTMSRITAEALYWKK